MWKTYLDAQTGDTRGHHRDILYQFLKQFSSTERYKQSYNVLYVPLPEF